MYGLKGSNDVNKMAKTLNNSSLNFKYSTLEKATGSFAEANKLGQGGFGTVYKASLVLFASNIQLVCIAQTLRSLSIGSSVGWKRDSCEEAVLQ